MLMLAVLVPALAFSGLVLVRFAEAERARLESRAVQIAGEATAALDRAFADMLGAARVVASLESLASGDLATFHRQAVEMRASFGASNIGLRDAESRQVLNTAVAWGDPLPAGSRLVATDARAAATGQPAFSGVFRGIVDGIAQFGVVLPLPGSAGPGAPRFLSLSITADRIQQILDGEMTLERGMAASVTDRDGQLVARLPARPELIGLTSADHAAGGGQRSGTAWGRDVDGNESLLAYRWSNIADWRVGISVPATVLDAPLDRALGVLALAGACAFVLALVSAGLVARRITGAMRRLQDAGKALQGGSQLTPPDTGLREADAVGAALFGAARDLAAREASRAAAAEALRTADERFRVALLAAPVIAYTCDRALRYTWVTNPHRDTTIAAMIGKRDDELDGLGATPQQVQALIDLKREVIETGQGTRRDIAWTGVDGLMNHYDVAIEPLRDPATGTVTGATIAALDITARVHAMEAGREQEARQRLLINELNHRVKNTLASVQSIVAQTLRSAKDTHEARELIQRRLFALAAAHDVLTRQSWEGASLAEVLSTALAPHRPADAGRLRMEGPPVFLVPRVALALSLATHELATNAMKYGAWRPDSTGVVDLGWTLDSARHLVLRWQESGGPPIAAEPTRRGFGTRLIERGLAHDLGGEVRIDFAPEGLVCTVRATLAEPEDLLATMLGPPAPAYHSP